MKRSVRASDSPEARPAARSDAAGGGSPPGERTAERLGTQRAPEGAEWGRRKYNGSWAESLRRRLDAADFMNRALILAATLLLCVVPFFLIVAALAGGSAPEDLSRRFGLSPEATADIGHLVASSSSTSSAVTGLSWVFFVLGGLAGATAIPQLYQRVFDVPARKGPDVLRAFVWIALVVGVIFLASAAGPGLRRHAPVLFWLVGFVGVTGFLWFSMWFLLAARLPWRRLLPCAVATGACWTGTTAVFSAVLSGVIVGYDRTYGPIGAAFALMSLFIAMGVVLILGAALGPVWTDRGLSFRGALGKLERRH